MTSVTHTYDLGPVTEGTPDPHAAECARAAYYRGECHRLAGDLGQHIAPIDEQDCITVSAAWLAGYLLCGHDDSKLDMTTTETPAAVLIELKAELDTVRGARTEATPSEQIGSYDREAVLWRAVADAVCNGPEMLDVVAHLLIAAAIVAQGSAQDDASWWRREAERRETSGRPA